MAKQSAVRNYRDLLVWQKGFALVKRVYDLTRRFPRDERFGLTGQMRRAAVSIPSNIAEGQARRTTGEFIQFISHAQGSVAELDTQLRLSAALTFCAEADISEPLSALDELRRMLNVLQRTLKQPKT